MTSKLLNPNVLLAMIFALGGALWFSPVPEGVTLEAWHLFAIFVCTIIAIIINPLPMGASSLVAIVVCVLTGTLTLEQCLEGFSQPTAWLIVFAFFISIGFIKTGLGARCAYFFISKLGNTTLGLTYGLIIADFILSPFIPSATSRGGGIIYPIAQSLCKSYGDDGHIGTSSRTGAFIMKVCYQANVITSALFLTAMAANPLIVKLSGDIGVKITWTSWALMMIVPGIFCLVLMPLLVYFIYPPTIKHSEEAPIVARKKLEEMGPIGINEVVMMLTFILLVTLWIIGADYGISATATAAIGLSILFVTRAIKFDDAVSDKTAWHTFMWFATLVMLSGYLTKFGIMEVMGTKIASMLPVGQPIFAISILMLIYFFSHIFFASSTAHITVFFPTFLIVLLNLGMAPMVAAMSLGSLSILSGGITHFGLASAPIFFGANYLKTKTWWSIGFVCSLLYLLVLATVGLMWWKILGYM